MLREIKPRNARSKRALEHRAPQLKENPKTTLFLRGSTCSAIVQLVIADLNSLKKPLCVKFNKKNEIHPFEDASSLEFFSEKNDASLVVFGHHSKKRPHAVTIARMFNHKVLDMIELYVNPDTMRSLQQFKNQKCASGLKPLLSFSGTAFESPSANSYTLAKSIFIDLFKGQDAQSVDAEGLQYMIHFSSGEDVDSEPQPEIHMRCYLVKTKKSGQKLPRVEIEEMGPRIDFRIGRTREADENVMKEALKKPKQLEHKPKKNIETDLLGDKVGRIHLGKQNLNELQTRKMKGLKRNRNDESDDEEILIGTESNDAHESKREKL